MIVLLKAETVTHTGVVYYSIMNRIQRLGDVYKLNSVFTFSERVRNSRSRFLQLSPQQQLENQKTSAAFLPNSVCVCVCVCGQRENEGRSEKRVCVCVCNK